MLDIAQTGCRWRYLPESFGLWTRVWSHFRRWSRNGTWARVLAVVHAAARKAAGRTGETPSMARSSFPPRHANATTELLLEHLTGRGVTERLELVLVDRGVTAAAAARHGRRHGLEVRRVGWTTSSRRSDPSSTLGASRWRMGGWDVAGGWPRRSRTPPHQRPAGSKGPVSPLCCDTSLVTGRSSRLLGLR
jgi:Putative transposase of IS4/5 family (DUF4096)